MTMAPAKDLSGRHLPDQETQRRHDGGEVARRGLMLVLSSPSGAGKTTLSRMLLDRYSTIELSDLGDDAQATSGRGGRQGLSLHR